MKILVLDNYDSFTYNLVYLLKELGYNRETDVFRNDKISLENVAEYDKILLSPGPGLPASAGIMPELISQYARTKSILGICLGHQGIAEVFGGSLFNMPEVLHGIEDQVRVEDKEEILFKGLPDSFRICHYHSWTVLPQSINGDLNITAYDQAGNVMGLNHQKFDVRGLQFHPESIITEYGSLILKNWLKI